MTYSAAVPAVKRFLFADQSPEALGGGGSLLHAQFKVNFGGYSYNLPISGLGTLFPWGLALDSA